jgi:hypothetical protein
MQLFLHYFDAQGVDDNHQNGPDHNQRNFQFGKLALLRNRG